MPLGNDKLLDQIFNLKFTSKQLVKSSSKCEKEEKTEKLKVSEDKVHVTSQNAQTVIPDMISSSVQADFAQVKAPLPLLLPAHILLCLRSRRP